MKLNELRKNILKEERGDFNYSVPENVRELFWDFYMYTYLMQYIGSTKGPGGYRTDLLDDTLKHVGNILLPSLKKHLLKHTLKAITSEFNHTGEALFDEEYYIDDINTAHAAFENGEIIKFVKIAQKIFAEGSWEHEYGGKAYAAICNAWLNLQASDDPNDIMIWADHIYDLQHNTGSIFSKSNVYKRHLKWLKGALNYKASKKTDPKQFQVSPDMRRIASYALMKHEGEGMGQKEDDFEFTEPDIPNDEQRDDDWESAFTINNRLIDKIVKKLS